MEKITSLLYHYTHSDPHNSNPSPSTPFPSPSLSHRPIPYLNNIFSHSLSPSSFPSSSSLYPSSFVLILLSTAASGFEDSFRRREYSNLPQHLVFMSLFG